MAKKAPKPKGLPPRFNGLAVGQRCESKSSAKRTRKSEKFFYKITHLVPPSADNAKLIDQFMFKSDGNKAQAWVNRGGKPVPGLRHEQRRVKRWEEINLNRFALVGLKLVGTGAQKTEYILLRHFRTFYQTCT